MRKTRSGILVSVLQKIFLSPHLNTYLKLLTTPTIQIKELIEQELSTNPLLEAEEGKTMELYSGMELADWITLSLGPMTEREEDLEEITEEEEESVTDEELDKILSELSVNELFGEASDSEEAVDLFENLKRDENLRDYLYDQCKKINLNEEDRKIAEAIIDNLDERGFLLTPPEEIAKREEIDLEKIEKIRKKLMKEFEPEGVGALNFEEFLSYQLETKLSSDPSLQNFINKCAEILISPDSFKKIKEVGLDIQELKENLKKLRKLRPFPLYGFHLEYIEYPNADVIVNKTDNGYSLSLNDEGIPRLRVNRYYLKLLKQPNLDNETKKFLKEKKRNAELFIKSLDMRNKTIYKVAEAIVEFQKEFFEKGVDFIKPMKLKDVAEKIGVDESTVSRAIANKSIATEFGVFPLRFFFHSAIDTEHGEKISSVYLKNRIKELIESEDKNNPLSDSEILEILRREGVKIARRTVAKYREELGILSAPMRKRINLLGVKS